MEAIWTKSFPRFTKSNLGELTMIFLCVVPYTVPLAFSQETNTAVSFQIHAPPETVVGKEIHDP